MMEKKCVEGEQRIKDAITDAIIVLENEQIKKMGKVAIKDQVQCINDVASVSEVWDDVEIETMVLIKAGDKQVILRKYHPVVTEKGIVVACELKKGMKVWTYGTGYEPIEKVCEVNYYDRVIDIDFKRDTVSDVASNIFYMNGIAVGDYTYENHLEFM